MVNPDRLENYTFLTLRREVRETNVYAGSMGGF